MHFLKRTLAVCAIAVLGGAASAATLLSTGGNSISVAAPADVTDSGPESDTNILIFKELSGFTLGSDLTLDIVAGQSHATTNSSAPEPVPPGHWSMSFMSTSTG